MRFSVITLLVIFFSCQSTKQEKAVEMRDSLVNEYLMLMDSLILIDTPNVDRNLLSAYKDNDTSYMFQSVESLKHTLSDLRKYENLLECYEPQAINTYDFKEAYRYEYHAAFCNRYVSITVGERNDSVFIFSYLYTQDMTDYSCISVDSLKSVIKTDQWNEIKLSLDNADFWGLKTTNRVNGLDGSGLNVIGYRKPVNAFRGQYGRVYRWGAERTALGENFKQVLDLSGINVECFLY